MAETVAVEDVTLDADLTEDIPCEGVKYGRSGADIRREEDCSEAATWRGTVRCCGTRSRFQCDECMVKHRMSGGGLACCFVCGGWTPIVWRKL